MNYTEGEIEFINFCSDKIDCDLAECPSREICEENDPICREISKKMRRNEDISDEDKQIIDYFWKEKKTLAQARMYSATIE